ncbi:MAG TPA: hypothetical protein P5057_02135 [Acidobacteriota bacterium]|nr:hypothetical protein [Acidobacteriota bacterium]HRR55737.1 hypothetical protein [Acidobacteriota bacterium]
MSSPSELDRILDEWCSRCSKQRRLADDELKEVQSRVREEASALTALGLSADEAHLLAVRRLAKRYPALTELLPSLLGSDTGSVGHETRLQMFAAVDRRAVVAFALAVAAAVAVKLPFLFGIRLTGSEPNQLFYLRNCSLLALPFLAIYFAWDRGLPSRRWLGWSVPFLIAALLINLYPFQADGQTQILAALHLPIVLWLAVGFAHVGGDWRDHARRMQFIRFSGEWVVYFSLIGLGGGVLVACTQAIFASIGVGVEAFLGEWVVPCGAAGAVLVAAWIAEMRQGAAPGLAPLLARLFTPLFALMLLVFLVTMLVTGPVMDVNREILIAFDLLLVLILGLLIYGVSIRQTAMPSGPFDALQLLLVVMATVVDLAALWVMLTRLSAFGLTPNRVAALGENLVLLVNLGISIHLLGRFVFKRASFEPLARWQTAYLPVYGLWAAVVVAVFPVLFGFR